MIFIKNQRASTTAADMHHFHHLFTSLQIKENENATNFFRRFTFARTEAEGVGNTYQDTSLVNFALAGLATKKKTRNTTLPFSCSIWNATVEKRIHWRT
jgi:hypothetical protein